MKYLAALALVVAIPAHAVQTYAFTFAGTQTHTFDSHECGDIPSCVPGTVTNNWNGGFVLTAPDGDGAFSFEQLSLHTGADVFSLLDGLAIVGLPPFGVTVQDGRVTEFHGRALLYGEPFGDHYTFDGMSLHLHNPPIYRVTGETIGEAQIAAVMTHAPEPETWALLLAGLGFVGLLRRRKLDA